MPRSKKSDSKLAPAQATGTLNIIFRGLCALVPRKNQRMELQDVVVLMPDARNPKERPKNKNTRFLPHPCYLFIDKECFTQKPKEVDHEIEIKGSNKYLWILDNDDIKFEIDGGKSINGKFDELIHMTSMNNNSDPNKKGLRIKPKLIKLEKFDEDVLVARTVIEKGELIPQEESGDHILPDSPKAKPFFTELKVQVSDVNSTNPVTLTIKDYSKKQGASEFTIKLDEIPFNKMGEKEIEHIIISNMPTNSIKALVNKGHKDYDFELVYSVRNKDEDKDRGFDSEKPPVPKYDSSPVTQPPLVCAMAVYNDEII